MRPHHVWVLRLQRIVNNYSQRTRPLSRVLSGLCRSRGARRNLRRLESRVCGVGRPPPARIDSVCATVVGVAVKPSYSLLDRRLHVEPPLKLLRRLNPYVLDTARW